MNTLLARISVVFVLSLGIGACRKSDTQMSSTQTSTSQTGTASPATGESKPQGESSATGEHATPTHSDTGSSASSSTASDTSHATTSAVSPAYTLDESKWKTYVNTRYGFEFRYPPEFTPRAGFEKYHILNTTWRTMAQEGDKGTAVVSIPIVRMDGRSFYPRYYGVDFRVGVSASPAGCAASNGERSMGPITINGVPFNQYDMSDAAMMQYVGGLSYRAEHNGRCYAIEQVRVGSNYRENPSPKDIPQTELDRYYFLAGKIVKTFRFR